MNAVSNLFAFIFLASFIFLVLGLIKPKYAFIKSRKKILQVYLAALVVGFIGVGITAEPAEQTSSNAEKVQEKTFEPKLQLFSKIVDGKLEVSGKTNFPDETVLVITLKNKEDKQINKNTTVKEGAFQLNPIPIEQLKTGNQSIEVSLHDNQPDSVIEIIGEEGKRLTGDLVNEEKKFIAASKITIPAFGNEAGSNKQTAKKPTQTSGNKNQIPVKLVKTIDGDTIKVIYNGEEKNVRYLLIDTPETNHPRLGKQPFGEEAKKRNQQLVKSGELALEFDVGERVDKYGRLLAYVYVDGESIQETLLKEGLARVAYVYPPNTRHLDSFRAAEKKAKDKKIGIWSIENYVTDSGFSSQASNSSSKQANRSAEQKSSSGKTESYKNCTELRKVYPNGVPKDHPAYDPKHDRDKDGWACER